MKKQKTYDDDDGRTIADMSGVGRSGMFTFRSFKKNSTFRKPDDEEAPKEDYTSDQRKAAVGGALSAALLIAGAFIGAGEQHRNQQKEGKPAFALVGAADRTALFANIDFGAARSAIHADFSLRFSLHRV